MGDETMDALVWLGPRQLDLRHVPVPEPAPGEVLVAVEAVGICGSELSGYLGESSIRKPPLIMGHEAAGRIVAVGGGELADGGPPAMGERVAFNPLLVCGKCDRCLAGRSSICRNRKLLSAHLPGAFARFVVVPAEQCFLLPDDLSAVDGSLAEPLACGVRAAALGSIDASSRVLVLGAGPIGLCCLAAARAQGATTVYISDVADRRLEVARAWGASAAINARQEDLLARMHELAPGGVDVVIDAVGTAQTRDQAVRAVVPGGKAVYIGLHEETSPLPANYLIRQEITVIGTFAYTQEEFGQALALLAEGRVRADPSWVEQRPLAAGPESFEELIAGRAAATKIVLIP